MGRSERAKYKAASDDKLDTILSSLGRIERKLGITGLEDKKKDVIRENPMSNYDSTADTLKHIKRVNELLGDASKELIRRGQVHDNSKLESPEKEIFDEFTPKLKNSTYGSDEYKSFLESMGEGLRHHYANNSHHPEHYENGIDGMDLFDLLEMLLDWKAATERHADGDLMKSIEINRERFGYSDLTANILRNTVKRHLS